MQLCGYEVGNRRPFFLIAGPCVIESEAMALDIAHQMKEITAELGIPYIFKASYDKPTAPPERVSAVWAWKRGSRSSPRCALK